MTGSSRPCPSSHFQFLRHALHRRIIRQTHRARISVFHAGLRAESVLVHAAGTPAARCVAAGRHRFRRRPSGRLHADARSGDQAHVFLRTALRADDVFLDFAYFVEDVVRCDAPRTLIIVCRHSRTPSALVTNYEYVVLLCYMHQYTKRVGDLRFSLFP